MYTKGKQVHTLIAGTVLEEGKYRINWDGSNYKNNHLPKAVYSYSLKGESGWNKSAKIILSH